MTSKRSYEFRATLWRYEGKGGWHFITLPTDISAEIRAVAFAARSAWGSVSVTAGIGKSRWETSIFPDKKAQGFLLPVKADIRKKEKIAADSMIDVAIELHL